MHKRYYLTKYLTFLIITITIYVTSWLGASPVLAAATAGKVSAGVANIRSAPNTAASIAGTAYLGASVMILSQSGEWYQVQCSKVTGWMHQSVLTLNSAADLPAVSSNVSSNQVPAVILDKQPMSFDVPPAIENGRILVPLAAIFQAMGATVSWDQSTQTVTAVRGDTRVILPINSNKPTVNGVVWNLDVPARITNNRTLAPLRFVGEALGGTVVWDAVSYTAKLTSPPQLQDSSQKVAAVYTGANSVNLRNGPDTAYAIVDTAKPGEILTVLGNQNNWYLVTRGAGNAWVAGWVVTLIHQGEDIPASAEPPAGDPSQNDDTNSNTVNQIPGSQEVGIAIQDTEEGIKVVMESGSELDPVVRKSNGEVTYKFDNCKIVGAVSLEENLGSSKLTVMGTTQDDVAIVKIQFPTWVKYTITSENEGFRDVFLIPNCITSFTRKTFGNGGENLAIATAGNLEYSSAVTSKKLQLVLKNTSIGLAQSSYNYNSPLISSITFKSSSEETSDTIMTITTKQAAKFAVGKAAAGNGLTIMFIDKAQLQSSSDIIVLDAGHGGYDAGASGQTIEEKNINLPVVLKIGQLLTAKGMTVIYTRQDDTYVSLDERSDIANLYNAAVFVSVHCNASTNQDASGTETYCYYPESNPQLYLQKEERYNLALRIQQTLVTALETIDRGVKQGNLSVLRKTDMPSALVEMAFISNHAEEIELASSQFRDKAAHAIADAINSYVKAYVN